MKINFTGTLEIDPADLPAIIPPTQTPTPQPVPTPDPDIPAPTQPAPPPVTATPAPVAPAPVAPAPSPANPGLIRLEDYNDWNRAVNQHGKILRLEPNKEYAIEGYNGLEPNLTAILGSNSRLVFGQGPQNIFTINSDEKEFGTVGVHLLQRADAKIKPATATKILYRTNHLTVKTGKLAMIGSQAPDDQRLTVQLAWAFSGTDGGKDGLLHIIGKDLRCNGPDFMNLKANAGGGLYSTLINVIAHNPDSFNPNEILVQGIVNGDRFLITSNHEVSDILTHYGYQNGNIRSMLHIGRFIFNINDRAVISEKEIRLFSETDSTYHAINRTTFGCKLDLQPGDLTNLGKIISKQISVEHGFEFVTDGEVPASIGTVQLIKSSFNLSGPLPAFLIYKGNMNIQEFRKNIFLNEESKFGEWQILIGAKYGHTSYNHSQIGGFWQNFRHHGMYRQSDPANPVGTSGKLTLDKVTGLDGYTNRWGIFLRSDFSHPKIVNEPCHPDSLRYIASLEALQKKHY
jgi:hypothetical protein